MQDCYVGQPETGVSCRIRPVPLTFFHLPSGQIFWHNTNPEGAFEANGAARNGDARQQIALLALAY